MPFKRPKIRKHFWRIKMNTLKIECSKDDYIIKTAKANSENDLKVEVPEDWNCDYVNAVLWEDDICEILENSSEHTLHVPGCGELLLLEIQEEDKKHISISLRYEDLEILLIKV